MINTEDTYVILSRLNSFWSTALRLTGNTRHWTQMQTIEAELVQFNDLMAYRLTGWWGSQGSKPDKTVHTGKEVQRGR